jgi:16S rRNA (cytosine1402-N4)-methyltransferase
MLDAHRPVLVEEVARWLCWKVDGTYLDLTVGAGGHSEAILKGLEGKGRLIGIDCDEEILEMARRRLAPFGTRAHLLRGHYDDLPEILAGLGLGAVDGLLLDLGLSSWQLDRPERGFSFLREGPLDMRMDLQGRTTAADLLNRLPAPALEKIFRDWGEERFARRIARSIATHRRTRPLESTKELASLILQSVPFRKGSIHPATRVFQALRIAVNREIDRLGRFFTLFPNHLPSSGRAVFLAYHSLEDRLVKRGLREWKQKGVLRILTQKPIRPAEQEVQANPRSRSARLRVCERTGEEL